MTKRKIMNLEEKCRARFEKKIRINTIKGIKKKWNRRQIIAISANQMREKFPECKIYLEAKE